MRPFHRLFVGVITTATLILGAAWWRSTWLRDHPLSPGYFARLAPVEARVEGCLRERGLALSEVNARKLTRCVCAGPARTTGWYCYVGDGFVAFSPEALPPGVFRVAGHPASRRAGLAFAPSGLPPRVAPEFDHNFGTLGPSSGPRAPDWYLVGFCPGCD